MRLPPQATADRGSAAPAWAPPLPPLVRAAPVCTAVCSPGLASLCLCLTLSVGFSLSVSHASSLSLSLSLSLTLTFLRRRRPDRVHASQRVAVAAVQTLVLLLLALFSHLRAPSILFWIGLCRVQSASTVWSKNLLERLTRKQGNSSLEPCPTSSGP